MHLVSWPGGRVSLHLALHTQSAARVALGGRECVYQHTVLHVGRAIRVGTRYAVQMRRRIVYCTQGVQYVLPDGVADAASRVHRYKV